jgi:hypothetical protein
MAMHSTVQTSAVRPNEPARQVIATLDKYADAERAVDFLADQGLEVNRVAIVGRDLEYVKQILDRLPHGEEALRGAGSGALFGLVTDALQRGQRDLRSTGGLRPGSYDLVADVEVAHRAVQLISSKGRE